MTPSETHTHTQARIHVYTHFSSVCDSYQLPIGPTDMSPGILTGSFPGPLHPAPLPPRPNRTRVTEKVLSSCLRPHSLHLSSAEILTDFFGCGPLVREGRGGAVQRRRSAKPVISLLGPHSLSGREVVNHLSSSVPTYTNCRKNTYLRCSEEGHLSPSFYSAKRRT